MAEPQNRRTAEPRRHRSGRFVPLLLLTLAGCATVRESEPVQSKDRAATMEPATDPVCQERPGRTAITVQWGGARGPDAMQHLPVQVTNTSPIARSVTLLLAGTSPNGQQVVEQKWSELVLAAGEARALQLRLDQVPIQSTGRPSGLSVIAQFAEPGAPAKTEKRVTFTEPLFLTHETDFKAATVRSLGEQKMADAATPNLAAILQAPLEIRVRNERTGAMAAAATHGETGNDWSGAMVVRDVSPEEFEASLSDPNTPDTEVLAHDGGPGFEGETL